MMRMTCGYFIMNICLFAIKPDALSLNSCSAHYITANFNYLPVNGDGYNLLVVFKQRTKCCTSKLVVL